MNPAVRQALAIDASSTIADRTIDITTIGRRSGAPRRIEIVFYRLDDDIYLSGIPAPTTRHWLANRADEPQFTFHLKHGIVADLSATATVIVDPAERLRVLSVFVDEFNRRNDPESGWPAAVLDDWVEHSPLAKRVLRRSINVSVSPRAIVKSGCDESTSVSSLTTRP